MAQVKAVAKRRNETLRHNKRKNVVLNFFFEWIILGAMQHGCELNCTFTYELYLVFLGAQIYGGSSIINQLIYYCHKQVT